MNSSREHDGWLDATATERLLSGEPVARGADGRVSDLDRVLRAAAEPLAGDPEHERAALAAFRQTVAARPAVAEDRPRRTRCPRRTLPVRAVIAGVAAVFAVSGVAIAAQTGALPSPFRTATHAPRPQHPSAAPASRTTAPGTNGPRTAPPSSHPSHPAPSTPPAKPAAPGLKGLCQAHTKPARHGKPLDAHSRARLERAAGGPSHVAAYCAHLLGTDDKGAPERATATVRSGPKQKAFPSG
jgi:hypothetical protein